MPAWHPGDPWPSGLEGGATSPRWGGYVRLFVRAALEAGTTFHMGAHANDRLDAGNVLGGGAPVVVESAAPARLWHDLSCDALSVDIAGGASTSQSIFSKPDAATLQVTLADPYGIYDPWNPDSPFEYGGRSRLVPGVPVEVFAEVVDGDAGTSQLLHLFTGTADSWSEPWVPRPQGRTCQLVATDAVKSFVRFNRPETAAVGAGETTAQRVNRIVTYFAWTGTVDPAPASTVTLQATTHGTSAWEQLQKVLDDEIGTVYVTADGHLRWTNRAAWFDTSTTPVLELGCDLHDVLVDASPSTQDENQANKIHATRTGGVEQLAQSTASIARFGVYELNKTDLGLQTDTQASRWATDVLQISAYPRYVVEDVTLQPGIDPQSWKVFGPLLQLDYVTDLVRIRWSPPDRPLEVIDGRHRVVGLSHSITRGLWEAHLQLVSADLLTASGTFHLGPHANDRLDAGFVLGL